MPLRVLLNDPKTAAALRRIMPGLDNVPGSMLDLTMRQAASRRGRIDGGTLEKINAMLERLA